MTTLLLKRGDTGNDQSPPPDHYLYSKRPKYCKPKYRSRFSTPTSSSKSSPIETEHSYSHASHPSSSKPEKSYASYGTSSPSKLSPESHTPPQYSSSTRAKSGEYKISSSVEYSTGSHPGHTTSTPESHKVSPQSEISSKRALSTKAPISSSKAAVSKVSAIRLRSVYSGSQTSHGPSVNSQPVKSTSLELMILIVMAATSLRVGHPRLVTQSTLMYLLFSASLSAGFSTTSYPSLTTTPPSPSVTPYVSRSTTAVSTTSPTLGPAIIDAPTTTPSNPSVQA